MMNIVESTIEKLDDPFGILSGDRYEIFLSLVIDEEDELYSEHGIKLKLIYVVEDDKTKIAQYDFIENTTGRIFDFALEEEEEEEIKDYCQQLIEQL
ncbi:pullulanase [Metabacillus sediminilitoris]|uniref:Pullulanase n=2 Tax=Metabacillus sediminilitoris TaxID=2567941 RepID=A0A4S4C600_9BACI|nr:pullulanase [Metabacillus sediminilitoris]THF83201.1 pullulanase [Metabacillus sediminilitoris]